MGQRCDAPDSLALVGLLVGRVRRWFLDREQDRAQQVKAAHRVSSRVGGLPVEVGVEFGDQGGHGRCEPLAVLFQGHRRPGSKQVTG